MGKTKYIKPVATAVKLDPKSAVLSNCIVGGGWFQTPTTPYCLARGGTGGGCTTAVRGTYGGPTISPTRPGALDEAPS